jgi:hypothetical protein
MKAKKIVQATSLMIPLMMGIGCNNSQSSNNSASPTANPTTQPTGTQESLLIQTSAILISASSVLSIETADSNFNPITSDTSAVTATLYSDSACSNPVTTNGFIFSQKTPRSSVAIEQSPFAITCSALTTGLSSCSANWPQINTGSYFVQAQTSASGIVSACSSLAINQLSLDGFASDVNSVIGNGNGYNLTQTDSNNVSVQAISGLTYQISIFSSTTSALSENIQSSIGSTIVDQTVPGQDTTILYTVGNLTAAVTDVLTVTDEDGLNYSLSINLQPSMLVSFTGLESGQDSLQAEVDSGAATTFAVTSGGTAPYTYSIAQNANIGSTLDQNGLYTPGFTLNGTSETVQVVDSLGNLASVQVEVFPNDYELVSRNQSSTTTNLAMTENGNAIDSTLSQWTINGVAIVDNTTSVTFSEGAGYSVTFTNCQIVSQALVCDASATTMDTLVVPVGFVDTSGNNVFSSTFYYSEPTP